MTSFATFWSGSIDSLERACLSSFQQQGHRVILYTYEEREPSHLFEARAASEILSERFLSQFITRGRPNIAAFSDAFRVTMFTKTPHIWIDCDLLLRAPLTVKPDENVFVREGEKNIIAAILRIADQNIANRALEKIMEQAGRDLPWAALQNIIPKAIAAENFVGKFKEPTVYNPIEANDFYKLILPEFRTECESLCNDAETIHLYNNILQKIGYFKDLLPPEGSYLHGLLAPFANSAGFIGVYPDTVVRSMVEGWQLRFSGKALGVGAVVRQFLPAIKTTVQRRFWG